MEQELFSSQGLPLNCIAGIDEAGRGPLAGPVCAACVLLPDDFPVVVLNDSKHLTHREREQAEAIIKKQSVWAVAWATAQEIDTYNILQATMLAMTRALRKVQKLADVQLVLIDGNRVPAQISDVPCQAIVKGDAKVPQIMAASILAKEARDRYMDYAAKKWPQYGFEIHKGYPTALHQKNLRRYGFCPIHRRSFHLKHQEHTQEPSLF